MEDLSWKACPPNYQYNANLDIVNGPGFESTLDIPDFQHDRLQQLGLASSTPVVTPYVQQTPDTVGAQQDQRQLGAVSRHGDRFPSRVPLDDLHVPVAPADGVTVLQHVGGTDGATAMPPGKAAPQLAAPGGTGQLDFQQVPANIQSQIDDHRATNQAETVVNNRPGGINITDLRKDENLRADVNTFMETVIRTGIPALAAAPTATLSGAVPQFGNAQGQGLQSGQMLGDGIRVTPGTSQPSSVPGAIPGQQYIPPAMPTTQVSAPHSYSQQLLVQPSPLPQQSLQQQPSYQPPFQQQPSQSLPLQQQQPGQSQRLLQQQQCHPQQSLQQLPAQAPYGQGLSGHSVAPPMAQQHAPQVPAPLSVPMPQHQQQSSPASFRTEFRCSPTSGR